MISLNAFSSIITKISLLLGLFLFNAIISNAQKNSSLRVVVISEEDGNPLAGSNVLLYEPGNEDFIYSCATDTDGFCEIRNIVPDKEYELRITFIGFKPHSEIITLAPDDRRIIRTILQTDVATVEEVTIQGQRYITTGEVGVQRISPQDISRVPTPAAGGDLVSYLQTQPGVVTVGDRGGNLFIRGGTPNQNLVLVDNMPIVKPFHISNLFSAFPQSIIQNANVFAGGFGAKYSGVTSAVVDVNLRAGNKVEHKSSAALSPYLFSLQVEGPVKDNRQSYMLSGRKSTIERFGPTFTGEEIPLEFYDVVGRYSLQDDNVSCNFTGIRTYDSGQVVPLRNIDHSWTNTVLGGRCLGFDEQFKYPVEATVGYSHYRNTEGAPERTERLSSLGQLFLNIDLKQQILGVSIDYGFGLNFRTYNAELAERFTSVESFERKVAIINFYTSFEWIASDQFSLRIGNASQITTDEHATLEPRLRAAYQPDGTDRQEISLSLGKYAQTTSGITDERDIGTVFSVLKPVDAMEPLPTAIHGILGYQQRISSNFIANVEGYAKDHSNIRVSKWNPAVGLELETTRANGLVYGFDAKLEYANRQLYGSLSYGWSKVEYEAASGDLGAWIREPIFSYSPAHDQRHKLNAIGSYSFGGFTTNVSWEFSTGRPYTRLFGFDISVRVPDEDPQVDPGTARTLFTRPYGQRLPYYHRLDISLEHSFELSPAILVDAQIGAINSYDRNNIFSFDFHSLQRIDQTPLLPYFSLKINKL